MKVKTMQPVEGAGVGEVVEVPEDRGRWLIANGYATAAAGNPEGFDGVRATTVPADVDPTSSASADVDPPEKPKPAKRR